MSIRKIKQRNPQKFLDDIRRVRDVMVYAAETKAFLRVTKTAVLKEAEEEHIKYYISDEIFKVKRDTMVIY